MDQSTLVVIILAVMICIIIYAKTYHDKDSKGRKNSISAKSSILEKETCKRTKFKIRVVHHGNPGDRFWIDVGQGMKDASLMFGDIEIEVLDGVKNIVNNIYGTITNADALIVTCPFFNGSSEYDKLDRAIQTVIDNKFPVITMNTDTYENPNVIQYVGSLNKLLGLRAARIAYEKWKNDNSIEHIVCFVTEKFNITLDWRADSFIKEFNILFKRNAQLHKCYTTEEVESQIYNKSQEKCFILSLGLVTLQKLDETFSKFDGIKGCQCGDTGSEVSQLCHKYHIPFVGQQQYQQGFSAISAMCNILINYNKGETWNKEQGNSASVLNATFECTEESECVISSELNEVRDTKKTLSSDWIQIGVAIFIQGTNIASWDEYDEERRKNDVFNVVHLENDELENVKVIDGTINFDASDKPTNSKRYYRGVLNEHFKFLPIYERNIDREQSKYQYYVVMENSTRVLATSNKGIERISDGMFLKIPYSNSVFRVLLYDRDELFGLQRALKGTLGNKCADC